MSYDGLRQWPPPRKSLAVPVELARVAESLRAGVPRLSITTPRIGVDIGKIRAEYARALDGFTEPVRQANERLREAVEPLHQANERLREAVESTRANCTPRLRYGAPVGPIGINPGEPTGPLNVAQAMLGAEGRRLRVAASTYRAEVGPKQVRLARAFGWGPSELAGLGAGDLQAYQDLADQYPDALHRMRAVHWTSIKPDHADPVTLRMWLDAVLGAASAGAEGIAETDGRAGAQPRRVSDADRELADRACVVLGRDSSAWHVVSGRGEAGRPNLEALALALDLTGAHHKHRFRPERPVGRMLEPQLDGLWQRCFETARPQ